MRDDDRRALRHERFQRVANLLLADQRRASTRQPVERLLDDGFVFRVDRRERFVGVFVLFVNFLAVTALEAAGS
ncbi:hypothetical protein AB4Y44_25075 [Paraburkholderia sp. BR10937]|uniref:hypothetical protein n=1 Tax=Paraburkholderia sp. BR10937 TaxID=3236994 RepID=UPI0034D31EA0